MGSLFSSGGSTKKSEPQKKKENRVTSKDRAVLDLKNSRDRLKKYKKKTELESEKLKLEALALVKQNNKSRALLVLKLNKHREKRIDEIENQLLSVLQMIEEIEWTVSNIKVMEALKLGTAALNSLHEEMSLEDVEELLNESNEAVEMERRIGEVIARQGEQFIDDDELERELEELMGGEKKDVKKENNQKIDLPEAPTHDVLLNNNEEIEENERILV